MKAWSYIIILQPQECRASELCCSQGIILQTFIITAQCNAAAAESVNAAIQEQWWVILPIQGCGGNTSPAQPHLTIQRQI